MSSPFTRNSEHVCQRCGLCCKTRGDLAFDYDDTDYECEPDDCTALSFANGMAVCRMQYDKRDCCEEYPWNELCERELKEAGLWEKYLDTPTETGYK